MADISETNSPIQNEPVLPQVAGLAVLWAKFSRVLPFAAMALAYVLWLSTPGTRPFIGYFASGYALAYIVYRWRGDDPRSFFDKKIWLHETLKAEAYLLLFSYVFIYYIMMGSAVVNSVAYAEVAYGLFDRMGLPYITREPTVLAGVLYVIVLMLTFELSYYVAHLLQHRNRYLWEFHKVHHSAQVMTPFTSLRQHPVEILLHQILLVSFGGIVSAVFVYFFPSPTSFVVAATSNIIISVLMVFGNTLGHSHVWISYGKLDNYLISPAMHQIHHSRNPRHYDKNLGFMLTCWDRLFGTAYIPKEREELVFGLGPKEDRHYTTLYGLLIRPFVEVTKKIF